jgi:leader peptidase (prepilin peptidase) / N-methyltransferase
MYMLIILNIFVFLFGTIIGSFLNCLIWRLHKEESLMGRSYCPKCKKQIAWYDNIPILSYLILFGKCRHCHKPISFQYPMVEFITGVLYVLAFYYIFQSSIPFSQFQIPNFSALGGSAYGGQFPLIFRDFFIIAVMIVIFIIDLRWMLILDIVTLPACIVILITNLILGFSWQNLLISGIIGGSFFLLQFIVSNGKWIGGGDIRLGLLIGLIFGWPKVLAVIMLAYLLGTAVALPLIAIGKKHWGSKLPLGVFLSASSVLMLFYGDKILKWYLGFIGL